MYPKINILATRYHICHIDEQEENRIRWYEYTCDIATGKFKAAITVGDTIEVYDHEGILVDTIR